MREYWWDDIPVGPLLFWCMLESVLNSLFFDMASFSLTVFFSSSFVDELLTWWCTGSIFCYYWALEYLPHHYDPRAEGGLELLWSFLWIRLLQEFLQDVYKMSCGYLFLELLHLLSASEVELVLEWVEDVVMEWKMRYVVVACIFLMFFDVFLFSNLISLMDTVVTWSWRVLVEVWWGQWLFS